MKFNASKIQCPETISAVLASLIYDEENFIGSCHELLDFKAHCWTVPNQKYFYAVVIDDANRRLWIVYRGTDGKTPWGKLLSWTTINLRYRANKLGFHTGFDSIAKKSAQNISAYIYSGYTVYVTGQSQGAGVSVPAAFGLCDAVGHLQADLWCAPPAVNENGRQLVKRKMEEGRLSINNWVSPGDLISKKFLRQRKGDLAGRDVGEPRLLGDIIHPKYGLFEPVSHSPRVMLAGYLAWLIEKCHDVPQEDVKLISHVIMSGMVVN